MSTLVFIVRNTTRANRAIKVFNTKINPNGTLDLMKIPGVTEENIRAELIGEGSLRALFLNGILTIVSSTVNLLTADAAHNTFLESLGIINGSLINNSKRYLGQATWFISWLTGNDDNAGDVIGSPVKTFSEITRRWGTTNPEITAETCTITIIDHNIADTIYVNFSNKSCTLVTITGSTPTVLQSGTLTAVRALATATNVPPGITDSTISGGTWPLNKRIKLTSGASSGAYAWTLKDEGSQLARTTKFSINGTTAVVASSGNTYNIETLTDIFIGSISNNSMGYGSFPSVGYVTLSNLNIRLGSPTGSLNIYNSTNGLTFLQCSFQDAPAFIKSYSVVFTNSFVASTSGTLFLLKSSLQCHNGGGIGGVVSGAIIFCTRHSEIECNGFISQNRPIVILPGSFGSGDEYGSFDAAGTTFNPGGFGLTIGRCGTIIKLQTGSAGWNSAQAATSRVYGSGNAGCGLFVGPNSSFTYYDTTQRPTITGTNGDFQMATLVSMSTNKSIGYNATTFAVEGPFTNSWANIATASPTGFAGSAHDPRTGAHIIFVNAQL